MVRKIIFYIVLISAIIGFILIFISISGKSNFRQRNENIIYILLIGLALILPLIIYHYFNGSLFEKNVRKDNIKVYLPILKQKTKNALGKTIKDECFIYLFNDTNKKISTDNLIITPKKSHTFKLLKNEIIEFNNGITLSLDDNANLNVQDKKSQLLSIANDDKVENNIPQNVDFAFIIEYPFLGDLNYEIEK